MKTLVLLALAAAACGAEVDGEEPARAALAVVTYSPGAGLRAELAAPAVVQVEARLSGVTPTCAAPVVDVQSQTPGHCWRDSESGEWIMWASARFDAPVLALALGEIPQPLRVDVFIDGAFVESHCPDAGTWALCPDVP